MTTTQNTDRRRPFCRPSWLSIVWQNLYPNFNKSLMKAIHIWNLEEIWLKMTRLEWPWQQTLIGGGHFVCHLGYLSIFQEVRRYIPSSVDISVSIFPIFQEVRSFNVPLSYIHVVKNTRIKIVNFSWNIQYVMYSEIVKQDGQDDP